MSIVPTDLPTDTLIALGKSAYDRHDFVAALERFEAASEREPQWADLHNLRGQCYRMLGRSEEALQAFDRAIGINPDYAEAHLNRANTLKDLGRLEVAETAFRLAAEAVQKQSGGRYPASLAGTVANQHARLGDLYHEGGFLHDAAEQYRKASEICPGFADIRKKLGRVFIELGLEEAAMLELQAALEVNPRYAEARANLGLALFRKRRYEEAEAEWRRSEMENPGNAQIQTYLRMIDQAREVAEELALSEHTNESAAA